MTNLVAKAGAVLCVGALFWAAYPSAPSLSVPTVLTHAELASGFRTPPDSVKPWLYWYWMNDNVSKDGITKDLEAMARIGIGEAFIGSIGLEEVPPGKVPILSEEYWQLTEHAIREGARLGVNIGLFNSPGWSQSGGPWVKPTQAMRYMTTTELRLKGPQAYNRKLSIPSSKYPVQPVAVLAFPAPKGDDQRLAAYAPTFTSNRALNSPNALTDGDTATVCTFAAGAGKEPTHLDVTVARPITARSLVLHPAHKPFAADCEWQMEEAGKFRTVQSFRFDRSNPNVNVGPMIYGPVAISLPVTTGTKFRLLMKNISPSPADKNPIGLAELELSASPRLERYVEKQLGKMFPTPLPLWSEYQWTNQPETSPADLMLKPSQVMDITRFLASDGTLNWTVPAGEWVVMAVGVMPTGTENGPSAPHGRGLEVDKMNKIHLAAHFDAYLGKLIARLSPTERKAFKHVVADSYEMGSQNWTDGLTNVFRTQYGYDPMPYLPVLTGRIVGNADQSNRFLWDLRRLIADRVSYQYVGGLRELSQKNGMRVWLENYGHWGFPGEFLQYGGQGHDIAGEFWNEGELGNIECRAASSAAHIYGKNQVWAESFTAAGQHYVRHPALLKKRGDWSFTEGINHTLLHLYIHQPYEDRNPGINAPFGTEFNRKNTWFDQSKAFVEYLRRCMFMLQQGKPVNDVAYFIGEDAPKMTGTRNPELPQGYSFDYINAEVIRNRVSVRDGKLLLPDGMSYRLLVLPQLETIRPELLRKIRDLVAQGAVVLGPAPKRSPSLQNYPAADKEVRTLATELWGKVDGKTVKSAPFGKGLVLMGMDMQTALNQLKVVPDVRVSQPSGTPAVLYTHRTLTDGDLYFITNQTDQSITLSPAFRTIGRQPECWDPVTGAIRDLPGFTTHEQTTTVPLKLEPFQSCFVVFKKSTNGPSIAGASNFPAPKVMSQISGPWTVSFDATKRGPAEPVVLNRLTDWSEHEQDAIKYYSGTAIYRCTFRAKKLLAKERLYLNLGRVNVMARVKLNGTAVGSVWTAPWQVDITEAVQAGDNALEVEVVNTWVNRLIGDSKLPTDARQTWMNVNPYKPDSKLDPSGLIGPVTVQTVAFSGPGAVEAARPLNSGSTRN